MTPAQRGLALLAERAPAGWLEKLDPGELDVGSPRGRGYSVESDVPIPDPILDEDGGLEGLWAELASAQEALDGDSNDAEHDALYSLAGAVAGVLGRLGIRNPAREGKGEEE